MRFAALVLLMAQPNIDPSQLEHDVFRQVNATRQRQGLPPLEWDADTASRSRRHCERIALGELPFGHAGFRKRAGKGSAAAENIAQLAGPNISAVKAVQMWMNSNGHRRNLLGDYERTGIGVARMPGGRVCVTQIFWRR